MQYFSKTFITIAMGVLCLLVFSMISVPNAYASFPGRNGKIVFERGSYEPSVGDWVSQIYVINSDGSRETKLTSIGYNTCPRWSPDGKKIVFVSDRTGNHEIFVMKADGSHQSRLTNNPAYDQEPCWSPDGQHIAFTSNRVYGALAGTGAIFVMNADGSNVKQLTKDGVSYGACSWSPDGTKIAAYAECFQSSGRTDYTGYNIWVINAHSGHANQLTNAPGCNTRPCWSPDGSKIAFCSSRQLDGKVRIYVMNADGSNVIKLTSDNDPTFMGLDLDPCWSPDGTKIAFSRGTLDFNTNIYVMNSDGTGVTQLTQGGSEPGRFPDWQPRTPFHTIVPTNDSETIWTVYSAKDIVTIYSIHYSGPTITLSALPRPCGRETSSHPKTLGTILGASALKLSEIIATSSQAPI